MVEAKSVSYHDLTRYGLFLKVVRERIAEEHKRASQRQLIAKALADRARGEREWSQRSAALERANLAVVRLADNADSLNKKVGELQACPIFVRAMAELKARDMVQPGWDRTFAPAPKQDDDVEDNISFESLLRLEKDSGVFGAFPTPPPTGVDVGGGGLSGAERLANHADTNVGSEVVAGSHQ